MSDEFDTALGDVDPDRRSFLKRVVVGTAFAAPVVASFTMSGVQAVYAQGTTASGVVSGSGTGPTSTTSTTTVNPNTTTTTAGPNTTTTTSTSTSTTTTSTTTTTRPNQTVPAPL